MTVLALSASHDSRADAVQCNFSFPTNWINSGTGDWFVQSNWDDGVPDCPFPTTIPNGGTARIAPISGTPPPNARAYELYISYNAGLSGNLSVEAGNLETCNSMHVGYEGTGKLSIINGGIVSSYGADIAARTGSNGTAAVEGTNSQWTVTGGPAVLYVGGAGSAGGIALLTVSNGGTVNAASAVVYGSGTLTGNGTVTTTSGTTLYGTLEPSGGRLTIGGNLTFSGGSSLMECNVVPASADNVYVSGGAASLTGKLKVTMTGTFTPGTTYTLLHADNGRTNTFLFVSIKYPTNQCFTPVITYDANNVYLYLQPCT